MGKRGPRPSTDQEARGFPGRRPAQARNAAAEAAKVAKLLAPATGYAAAPSMLNDPKYEPALNVWKAIAGELRRTHRLPRESEAMLMAYCIYVQEWVTSTEDLHENGFTQEVGTVAGGTMERRRPATFDRQVAFQNMRELSGQFGLTPAETYQLFKNQALVAQTSPDLFDDGQPASPQPSSASADDAELDEPPSLVGSFGRMRSEPPKNFN